MIEFFLNQKTIKNWPKNTQKKSARAVSKPPKLAQHNWKSSCTLGRAIAHGSHTSSEKSCMLLTCQPRIIAILQFASPSAQIPPLVMEAPSITLDRSVIGF